MPKSFVLVFAFCLCTAVLAQPPAALVNPGFETAARGGAPEGWGSYVSFPGSARLALDRTAPAAGAAALRVEAAAGTRCAISQYVAVGSPGAYTFSCQVRAGDGEALSAQVQIEWFRAADWPRRVKLLCSETPSPALTLAAGWCKVAATGLRPAEADVALVAIIVTSGKEAGGTALVDEARFVPGAYPEPLVSNPGFEADANADGQPDGWAPADYGGGFELVRGTAVAHSGGAAARLTGAKNHGDRSCYYQATPLFTPPQKLRLSYWYKGSGAAALVMHLLTPAGVQKPGGGIEYATMAETPALKPQWQQFSKEIAVPEEARKAGIMRVDIILYQRGEGSLWYDDVKLELE